MATTATPASNFWTRAWAWLNQPDPPAPKVHHRSSTSSNNGVVGSTSNSVPALNAAKKLQTAVVHLKTDQVIKGAVARVDADGIVLKHASLAVGGPSGSVNWTRMDGEVVIAMMNVDFWQDGLDAALLDRLIDIPTK